MALRTAYVRLARSARRLADKTGTLRMMENSRRPWVRHLRTFMAIYDAADLAALGLPWWTYRAIRQVDDFLASRKEARVFEYGSGASTLWLAQRAAEIHSVEHDREFAAVMRTLLAEAGNVTLHEVPATVPRDGQPVVPSQRRGHRGLDFRHYVETIDRVGGPFDLVVVDGRARLACLDRALRHLSPGGIVVFDDAGRRRYRHARTIDGVDVSLLTGAKPCVPYRDTTALARVAQT